MGPAGVGDFFAPRALVPALARAAGVSAARAHQSTGSPRVLPRSPSTAGARVTSAVAAAVLATPSLSTTASSVEDAYSARETPRQSEMPSSSSSSSSSSSTTTSSMSFSASSVPPSGESQPTVRDASFTDELFGTRMRRSRARSRVSGYVDEEAAAAALAASPWTAMGSPLDVSFTSTSPAVGPVVTEADSRVPEPAPSTQLTRGVDSSGLRTVRGPNAVGEDGPRSDDRMSVATASTRGTLSGATRRTAIETTTMEGVEEDERQPRKVGMEVEGEARRVEEAVMPRMNLAARLQEVAAESGPGRARPSRR